MTPKATACPIEWKELAGGSGSVSNLSVQRAFIEPHAVGSGRSPPRLVVRVDVQAAEQRGAIVLIEVLEGFGSGIIRWILDR